MANYFYAALEKLFDEAVKCGFSLEEFLGPLAQDTDFHVTNPGAKPMVMMRLVTVTSAGWDDAASNVKSK